MPLHPLVQMEGDGFTAVADVPGVRQLGNDVHGHRIIRTGADQAVVSRGDRCIDPAEGGLVHVVEGNLLVTRTEEFASIAGLVTVSRSQR